MHGRAPYVDADLRGKLLTALSQRSIGLLLMELLDHAQIRSDLPRVASPMWVGFDTARPPIALEQRLDKAQADPKESCQVSL